VDHIIVEGCDGTGKTRLIDVLSDRLDLQVHPRASHSTEGPVKDLTGWVERELYRPKNPGIYDRHPIISETIYGPIVRNMLPGKFCTPAWVQRIRHTLAKDHMVVWCIPPWPRVVDNIMATHDNHMAGVVDNLLPLYQAYKVMANSWPGIQCTYDFTRDDKQSFVELVHILMTTKDPQWIQS
jgi:hypothetical protein